MRRTPGNQDPEAEVVALSPNSLMNSNRYVCEVCHKGFQRDQNLQLHRRGHNLPWKLKKKSEIDSRKKVYLCPLPSCPHHYRSRALGDITGIKKHFFRKHCEKKYKCLKCTKCYAVKSDWTAHMKNCGSNSYKCDCGLVFGRKDTYRSHKAFCEALAAETARISGSHPHSQLETSSEEDSAIETMNHYQGDMALPSQGNMVLPSQGFAPMLNHQLQIPQALINHQRQVTGTSSALVGINYPTSDGFQIMNINSGPTQLGIKDEPNTPDIYHPFAPKALAPPQMAIERNNDYTMSQAASIQNYLQQETGSTMTLLQTVNMIGGASTWDMMGSTMSQLQMGGGGGGGHGLSLPIDYYYMMGEQTRIQYPTRDFLGLSVGHGGGDVGGSSGVKSTIMGDYGVSLGGTNNLNLVGNWGCGGGMNVNGEGSEWVPQMPNLENANVHQIYGFAGGPSTSQGWNLHERK